MTKREIIIAVSGFTAAIILVVGGLLWHAHQQSQKKLLVSAEQNASVPSSDSSLNVGTASGASDLGQLGGNQSQGSGGSSSGGSGSSGNSGGLDPASFSQYDKYAKNQDALFGDIKPGTGTTLTAGHKASVTYKGWLTNGALIDQSPLSASGQPQPFSFTLGNHEVIPGWEEAMYGMKAGGTRLLIIPPAVGYGAQGKGTVPPNAVLVFEVQLLSVQ